MHAAVARPAWDPEGPQGREVVEGRGAGGGSGRSASYWLVLENHTDDEQAMVSFVYTNTPEEQAQADREAAAEGRRA